MKKTLITIFVLILSMQTAVAEKLLFVDDDCSFCNALKDHLTANNLYYKNDITEYEISSPENAALYLQKSQEVGYTSGGIPLLVDGSTYIEGKTPIINYLESMEETTAPPAVTVISEEDSIDLNEMIEEAAKTNPINEEDKEESEDPARDTKTTIIGIVAIIFGLTFFTTIIYRAKKRLKL